MPRRGRRLGAGRPPGRPNNKTVARREFASAAAGQEITPLELMLKRMRFYNSVVDLELEKGKSADRQMIDRALREAAEAAKDAAPYLHPRLSAIAHVDKDMESQSALRRLLTEIDGTSRGLPNQEELAKLDRSSPREIGGACGAESGAVPLRGNGSELGSLVAAPPSLGSQGPIAGEIVGNLPKN